MLNTQEAGWNKVGRAVVHLMVLRLSLGWVPDYQHDFHQELLLLYYFCRDATQKVECHCIAVAWIKVCHQHNNCTQPLALEYVVASQMVQVYAEILVDSYWLHPDYASAWSAVKYIVTSPTCRCKISWFMVRDVSRWGARITREAIWSSGRPSKKIESIRLPYSISGSGIWMQPWKGCSCFIGSLLDVSCNRKLLNWSCPGKSLMSELLTCNTQVMTLEQWAGFAENHLLKQRSYYERGCCTV